MAISRAKVHVTQVRAGKSKNKKKEYTWKFVVNGRVMAFAPGRYSRRRQAWRAFDHFLKYVKGGKPFEEITEGTSGRGAA